MRYNDGVKPTCTSRAAWLSAALLLLCLPPARSARPQTQGETLASLLRKHLRASGTPAALRDRRSQKTVFTLDAGGLTGTLTEYNVPPRKTRVEMVLGPIRDISADNGTVAWEQDMTGHVRLLSGPEMAESRATQSFSLEGYNPLRGGKQGRVTLRPQRESGTDDYVLDMVPTGGTTQTAYLDPHTFLIRKVVATKAAITGTITILAYKRIGGEQVPSEMQITYAGLPMVVRATLASAERGLPLSPTLFSTPGSAKDVAFLTADGTGPATIPFTDTHGEIVLPVTINGQPRRFLLDSGAGNSFITEGAAKGLN